MSKLKLIRMKFEEESLKTINDYAMVMSCNYINGDKDIKDLNDMVIKLYECYRKKDAKKISRLLKQIQDSPYIDYMYRTKFSSKYLSERFYGIQEKINYQDELLIMFLLRDIMISLLGVIEISDTCLKISGEQSDNIDNLTDKKSEELK